jgi:hypothetical protein
MFFQPLLFSLIVLFIGFGVLSFVVSLSYLIVGDPNIPTKSHANLYSFTKSPLKANTNEYVKVSGPDTNAWELADDGALVCRNPGTWQITSQYQMVGFVKTETANDATIDGWFIMNDIKIENSGASGYVSREGASNVLAIAYAGEFLKGDNIRFGIRSNTVNKESTDTVNAGISSHRAANGVSEPSLIITMIKTF